MFSNNHFRINLKTKSWPSAKKQCLLGLKIYPKIIIRKYISIKTVLLGLYKLGHKKCNSEY